MVTIIPGLRPFSVKRSDTEEDEINPFETSKEAVLIICTFR